MIRVVFAFCGICLFFGSFFTDWLSSFPERFGCALMGFLIFAVCQPSAALKCIKLLQRALTFLAEWMQNALQDAREDPEQEPVPAPSMTIATLSGKEPVNEITTEQEYQNFLASHVLETSFITKVVGVTFQNDDGSDRQEILSRCLRGEPVVFYWHDFRGSPACAIITDHGQIGHLRAELAARINADYMADGYSFMGNITDITGGSDGLSYGCNIMLSIYRDEIKG